MASLVGKRLSHYRILRRIGAGGMGHVYTAIDERVGRIIAVKLLPEGVLAGEADRRRFRREILALSEVRHPNIASVHDFDTQGDVVFLAMEYVRGETLASRIKRGPIPLEQACAVADRIAAALGAAHTLGVLHRDLKPSNVLLASDGDVKLLDFGLAKRVGARALPSVPDAETATADRFSRRIGSSMTRSGRAVGTPGYMSPEQFQGAEVDARTDVFAFGCVLFECLAGKAAFPGATASGRLASSLKGDPDWTALPGGIPAAIRTLIKDCLAKSAGARPEGLEGVRPVLQQFIPEVAHPAQAAARPAVPNNLPEFNSPLIGRDREVERVRAHIKAGRIVTITGPGGSGKTRLAVKIAESCLGDHTGGVWFVDLARMTSAERLPSLLSSAVGVEEPTRESPWSLLTRRFQAGAALVLLDNCEEFPDAVSSFVTDMLAHCPTVTVLATSRDPLGVHGETVFALGPLSVPRAQGLQTADSIAPYDAVAFFRKQARQVDPDFELTDANASAVASICRTLDGMPLALELAAARLRVLSVEELLERLNERFRILADSGSRFDRRHAALREVIGWTYDHLAPPEQEILGALAVFAGAPTARAIGGVWQGGDEFALLDHLNRLADRALVAPRPSASGETRYALLETVRAYVRERAAHQGACRLRDRHLEYYLELLAEAESGLKGADQSTWLARLEEEHDDILAALAWCGVSEGRSGSALRIANAAWRFWYLRGYLRTGRTALQAALALDDTEAPEATRAKALRSLAMLVDLSGEYAASRPLFEASLSICQRVEDGQGVAFSQNGLAGVAMNLGDHGTARRLYQEVVAFCRARREPANLGVALGNLGLCCRYMGDLRAAERHICESIRISDRGGDRGGQALNLSVLGSTRLALGKVESARRSLIQAIQIASEVGERRALAVGLKWTGDFALFRREPTWAARFYGSAEAIRTSMGATLWTDETKEMQPIRSLRRSLGTARFRALTQQAGEISHEGAAEIAIDWLRQQRRAGSGSAATPRIRDTEAARKTPATKTPAMKPLPHGSTANLLRYARKGDARAQNLLCRRFIPVLSRWAHGRLPAASRDLVDTDDMVQVTLARALGRLDRFSASGEGAFLAYMWKILLNQVRDEARRVRRRPARAALTDSIAAAMPSPLDDLVRRTSVAAYERELERLPRRTREAIVLRLELQYPYSRVAGALGLRSANAARMLVSRGLDRLSKRLDSGTRRLRASRVPVARPRPVAK